MKYKFNRAALNGEVLDVNAFEKIMNFVHLFNDAKNSSSASDAEVVAVLKAEGIQDAEGLYKVVRLISSGTFPTIEDEQEFMSDYANYTHEILAKNQQAIDELKLAYKNEERFVDSSGNSYTAEKLKKEGQKASSQAKKSKWARFGLIALVAIPVALVAGGIFSAVATWAVGAGLFGTGVISIASLLGLAAGAIAGGVLGKKWYDANGRKAKLARNIELANAYEQNKDLIAEQELELQNALAKQYSLRNSFGIEMDANGNEVGNAYEDIYNRFTRTAEEPEVVPSETVNEYDNDSSRYSPIRTQEDIDEFINGAYGDNENKYKRINTPEDIDEFVNSVFGPSEEEMEEETPEESEVAPIITPIITPASSELIEEADNYSKYLKDNLEKTEIGAENYSIIRNNVNKSVESVKNANSKEEQEEAIAELKATYIETRHIVNNNIVAPIMAEMVGTEAENNDYIRLVGAIEETKNQYERPIEQGSYAKRLEQDLILVQKEEALVHILKTYSTLKQTKYIIENSQQLDITPEERSKELQELGAMEKYLHIVIENALQEETTLEDLNRIINDGYKEVSYTTWLNDFDKDVQKFFKEGTKYNPISYFGCVIELQKTRNLIEQRIKSNNVTKKQNEEPEMLDLESVAERTLSNTEIQLTEDEENLIHAEIEEENKEQKKIEKVNNSPITISEETEEDEDLLETEEVVNVDYNGNNQSLLISGSNDIAGLLPAGESKKTFDTTIADEIMRREMADRRNASKIKDASSAYLVEGISEEELENSREYISKLVRKYAKVCGSAGRYVLAVIENNGYKYIAGSLNSAELKERKAEIKELIIKTSEDYKKYVIVPITNKVTKEKVEYYREISLNGENNGLKRGPKSDLTEVNVDSKNTYYSAMINDYITDYLASYNKILKTIEEDKKSRQITLKLAKTIVTTEIAKALKEGENPIAAVEKIMNSALKNLEEKAKGAALGVVDKTQEEM